MRCRPSTNGGSQTCLQTRRAYYRVRTPIKQYWPSALMTHAKDAAAARRSTRGQSIVEFALIVPILLMMFIAIADFGRIFAAIITLEASTRNAAEATANQYLAQPPAPNALQLAAPPGDPAYY